MSDLVVTRGDDFRAVVTLSDSDGNLMDLSSSTAKAQVRVSTALNAELLAEFVCDIPAPATDGVVTITLPHTVTEDLPRKGKWDLQITTDGWVTTVAKGNITVLPDVTRDEVP